jgi:pyruvate/2-oxoglutarate dehydrogenase complex dihydrolipoamide acyltransferase (E2) component
MSDIRVTEDLWASRMLPEGLVERWFVPDGTYVETGDRVAEIRIEEALHEIIAPAAGHLSIALAANSVIEPGSVIGRINP